MPPQWQAQNLWRVANVIQDEGTQHRAAVQAAWASRQAARRAAERARQWRLQQLENHKKEIKELIKHYDKQLLPEATDIEKARWRNVGYRVPSGRADDWWYVAEHPEWDDLRWDLSMLRATYKPLAKRQAALLQLEHTAFDAGLAVRRGQLQESEAMIQMDNAMQQAAAAGLPDGMIEATTQSMALKVREVIKREQAAAAQAQAQQDAILKIRALSDDIRQVGGWRADRHHEAFVAAGFAHDPATDTWHHPLAATSKEVADAQTAFWVTLDETRRAREQARRRTDIQQRWTARRERRIARYRAIIARLILEGPQGDFSNDDYEEELYDDALDFYWDADTRQWRHPYQAILQEDLDRLRQVLAEGRKLYEKEVNECARRLHLQEILENMLASETVEDLQPIVDELASMGCHRDASGQWGHQQANTEKGADLDRLIQLFNEVEQHYALQRVGQIIRLAADIHKSGWQADRHQAALLAAGFVQDPESGEYSHSQVHIPAVQAAVMTLLETIKNPGPQTTPPPPTPPQSPWRPRGPR